MGYNKSEASGSELLTANSSDQAQENFDAAKKTLISGIDQFWHPRHLIDDLGKYIVTYVFRCTGANTMTGIYDRYPFYELPPYSTAAVGKQLRVPSYLGYYINVAPLSRVLRQPLRRNGPPGQINHIPAG